MLAKFYVMGKALSGKLSCPCDRSCSGSKKINYSTSVHAIQNKKILVEREITGAVYTTIS